MKTMQDGVEVLILPDNACCLADKSQRSPLDIDECPIGCEECCGECMYYKEEMFMTRGGQDNG